MKPKSDGPGPVDTNDSEGDEPPDGTTCEHVIRGPSGFRVVTETTTAELIAGLGPNDRIHVVVIRDQELGKSVGTVTVVKGDALERLDELCALTDDPWHVTIKKAAYTQVCLQIWGGRPPRRDRRGTDLRGLQEGARGDHGVRDGLPQ